MLPIPKHDQNFGREPHEAGMSDWPSQGWSNVARVTFFVTLLAVAMLFFVLGSQPMLFLAVSLLLPFALPFLALLAAFVVLADAPSRVNGG
jgi:hypothetical protein